MKPMTSDEYAERTSATGSVCPFCGSKDLDDLKEGHWEIGGASAGAIQYMRCLKCGEKWYDRYELFGYVAVPPEVVTD